MKTTARRLPAVPIALAATLLTAFLLLFAPLSASAHDSLLASSPAADSTVETLPGELTLTFSAKLIDGEGATEVVVTDATGASVAEGPSTVDGAIVTQPLADEAAAGGYHVIWKIVSSDGHPTSGEFDFSVANSTLGDGTAAPTDDATTAPTATPSTESTATADTVTAQPEEPGMTSGFSLSPAWIIAGLVAALVVVFLAVMAARRRRGSAPDAGSDPTAER